MSGIGGKEIYDDLVSGYSAYANTNIIKTKYEVPEVLKEIGDIKGCKHRNYHKERHLFKILF